MSLIKNIESKIRMVKTIAFLCIISSLIIVIVALIYAYNVTSLSNKQIYILSDNTPIMALRTDFEVNRPAEYKAQIDYFHSLFFNITPDDKFIEEQMRKAMYLIDESGIQQYRNMKEKGFFAQILASNSVVKLMTDSIELDLTNNSFKYHGRQIIERKTSRLVRSIITTGKIKDIPRSENNAHGVLLVNWKTIENKDIDFHEKY